MNIQGLKARSIAAARWLSQLDNHLKKIVYVSGESDSEARVRQLYAEVLLSGANANKIRQEIEKTEQLCAATGVSFGRIVAQRIATADPDRVRAVIDAYSSNPFRSKKRSTHAKAQDGPSL